MHGCHDLVPRLSCLVQTFTKEPEERAPPKAPAEPRLRSQRQANHKIDKAWWPQGLVPFKKVCEALDAGEEPAGDITLASFEQIVSLQALAKTHNVSKSFALVCSNEPEQKLVSEYAGETKWVLFEGNRWKQVLVFPLLAQLPAWPSVPQIIQTKDPEDIGLVTVRVTISKQFLKQNEWEHAVKKPTDLLAAAIDEGSSWRTFGWHVIPKHEVIVGFMKVSSKIADSLLCGSGYRSCFFAKLDKIEARDPVKWIQRNEKSSPAQYLAEVRILAKERKAGIALRKGTKSNLGLIGLKNEDKGEEALRKRWVARSVPDWAPCQFTNVLQTGGWRLIEEVQPPNKKGGVWIFKGVPPPSSPPQGVVLALETGKQVFICPWVPKFKKPDSTPIFTSRSWVTVANRGVLFQDHKECAPTQMDNSESQDDDVMEVDGTAKRAPNSPPSVTTPQKKRCKRLRLEKEQVLPTVRCSHVEMLAQMLVQSGTCRVMATVALEFLLRNQHVEMGPRFQTLKRKFLSLHLASEPNVLCHLKGTLLGGRRGSWIRMRRKVQRVVLFQKIQTSIVWPLQGPQSGLILGWLRQQQTR